MLCYWFDIFKLNYIDDYSISKLHGNHYHFDIGNSIERSKFRYGSIKVSFHTNMNIMLPLHTKVEIREVN